MKKIKVLSLVSIILLCMFVVNIQSVLADNTRIAVLTFEAGNINWGKYGFDEEEMLKGITEQITNGLVGTEGISVIERSRVEEVLTEQDFGLTGRVDTSSAAKIGKILGVEGIILGSVKQMEISEKGGIQVGPLTVSGIQVKVGYTGRLVNTTTAEIMLSFKGEANKMDTGLSISDYKGISFGSSAFADSALGKSIEAANKDFVNNFVENMPEMKNSKKEQDYIEGTVVELLEERLVVDIGFKDDLEKGQTGKLIKEVEVEALDDTMTVPIGEVKVYHLEENAAILDVIKSEERPEKNYKVRF